MNTYKLKALIMIVSKLSGDIREGLLDDLLVHYDP